MLDLMKCVRRESSNADIRHSAERGFTLVEMLAVITIIFMIVVVTVPNMRRSIVRADLLDEVKMLRQAVGISRIHAVKNSRRVVLWLLDDDVAPPGNIVLAWIDENANDTFDGEEIIGRWPLGNHTQLGPDGTDASRSVHVLGGTRRGIVFMPNGTAIAHLNEIGVGQAAVVLMDRKKNQIRLTIQAGAGTVLEHMWNPVDDEWSTLKKYWIY